MKKVMFQLAEAEFAAPGVRVREVLRYTEAECGINQQVVGAITVPGFGATDCRTGCGSHLKRLP